MRIANLHKTNQWHSLCFQQQNLQLEMKNRCKSAAEAKAEHLLFVAAVFSTLETPR